MYYHNLGPSQYQHALTYQQHIRPNFRALRTCKIIFNSGIATYYGKNEFRFSSPFGGLVLARFLDLIGHENVRRLKHIAIAHPMLWRSPRSRRHFFVRRLSPFGMADLPNYADTYDDQRDPTALKDPLKSLQQVQTLKELTLLFYGVYSDADSRIPQPRLFEFTAGMMLAYPVNTMAWNETPDLQVKLLNLYPLEGPSARAPIRLRDIEATLWPSETIPRLITRLITTNPVIAGAMQVVHQMRSQRWGFDDALLCDRTGIWPLKQLPDGSIEDPDICEYEEGWASRESLEGAWQENCLGGGGGSGVWYDDCVKCWRRSSTKAACDCADGGTFLSRGWKGPEILIGNPGVPITVDEKEGDVMWAKSAAEKDMEGCDQNEWLAVFEQPRGLYRVG